MNRPITAVAVVVTLVLGVALGIVAGGAALPGLAATASSTALAEVSPAASDVPATPGQTATPQPTPEPTPTPQPTPEPTPTPQPTPKLVPDPLTGRLVTEAVANRPVVAVMIDDQALARPQSGLSSASVVWQAPAEGGIPRYMALFHDQAPPSVGPVRSARYYFIAWAAEWNAVYFHVGGSPQALALLHSADGRGKAVYDADEFRWGQAYMWRIKERYAPHNVYTDGKHLWSLAKKVGATPAEKTAAWTFAPDAAYARRPKGGKITVPYLANKIVYTYDRRSNRYLRAVTGETRQVDAGTDERVGPKNVVIILMSFAPLNDGSKKHRLEAQFIGKGTAWIATNGLTVKGTWRKASLTGATKLFGPDGKPVTLTVGQTFVQVVPIGTKITIKDGTVPKVPPRPATGGRADPKGAVAS